MKLSPARIAFIRNSGLFYNSLEWKKLRVVALSTYPRQCVLCGRSPDVHGVALHVSHIMSRFFHPELALEISNLQIRCEHCNIGQGSDESPHLYPPATKKDRSVAQRHSLCCVIDAMQFCFEEQMSRDKTIALCEFVQKFEFHRKLEKLTPSQHGLMELFESGADVRESDRLLQRLAR